ncbi:hypothetical protein MARPO_0001s0005 [Marchantia polymorpha]|uniref:HAT C-terminal dimerisation domain-containing protein n=1 Tax=Marchantia polymorpha TaxID=3197 RepID=A0A2R6XV04_MARPO|nr:hypothetical protein MARPO_0001s0005 [Marchantia polymorpha]|eukprot:PTQ49916.1 hypothetical protein MARPO_0001s0005 [Marchantia polymorpha]
MVQGVLHIRKPLEELLQRIRERHDGFTGFTIAPTDTIAKHIAEESWSALKDFASFLKPFKDVTVLLSASEYPTLGVVIPVFHMCTQYAKAAIAASTGFRSTQTIEFAKHVVAKLAEYDGKVRNNVTRIATALDPRTKAFMNGIGIRQAEIESELVAAWDDHDEPLYNRELASDARASGSMHQDKTATTSAMSSLLQLLQAQQPASQSSTTAEKFENEAKRWFEHQPMTFDQTSRNVCMWFKVNKALFPVIAFMARDYMGVTST